MQDKYQIEIDEFHENFNCLKNKRFVLYGIGRYTATLVQGLKDFNFVGLMDKDPQNIGKEMFGLPILSAKQAEENGDLVVINTSETYWDVIYSRIEHIKIPVYYKNGKRAQKKDFTGAVNPYSNLSLDNLLKEIDNSDVVSFDFFDTLFMRKVCNPRDVFLLLEREFSDSWNYVESYSTVRSYALQSMPENYTLNQLYDEIQHIAGLPHDLALKIKNRELELELDLLYPRDTVIEAMRHAMALNKEVYIISDMYLPKSFYEQVFTKYCVPINKNHILTSCELGRNKKDGNIWSYYLNIIGNKKALHVGDNPDADVKMPQQYGILTYQTPSAWDLLQASSLNTIVPFITDLYSSAITGCIISKLFNNPFALCKENGQVEIQDEFTMGYVVLGLFGEKNIQELNLKNRINTGRVHFIKDYKSFFGQYELKSNRDFVTKYYESCFGNRIIFFLKK